MAAILGELLVKVGDAAEIRLYQLRPGIANDRVRHSDAQCSEYPAPGRIEIPRGSASLALRAAPLQVLGSEIAAVIPIAVLRNAVIDEHLFQHGCNRVR